MKPALLILTMAFAVLATGCQTTSVSRLSPPPTKKMERNAKVYIAVPRDGSYEEHQYEGSGEHVADALDDAFAAYTSNAVIGKQLNSTADAIAAAESKGSQYAVVSRIEHWEDRATEWSGIPDRIEVVVEVVAVPDGTQIEKAQITGRSSEFTFGGDHPQDLLKEPITMFVGSLF